MAPHPSRIESFDRLYQLTAMGHMEHMMCSISIVIPVRNRWNELRECLSMLAQQQDCPQFEVIIVDDGSQKPVPDWLQEAISSYDVPVRLKQQAPLGIAAARNQGLNLAIGELVLFLDSDSLPTEQCLACLAAYASQYPEDVAFQFKILSNHDTWVGRMDSLFLTAVQNGSLTDDGHILYADTAGFAVRRDYFTQHKLLFDVGAIRGSDTLVMTALIERGKQPRFIPDTIIYHNHETSLLRFMQKHFTVGYRTGRADKRARDLIARASRDTAQRRQILRELTANAPQHRGGYRTLGLILIAYGLKLIGRGANSLFGLRVGRHQVLHSPIDAVTSSEVVARLIQAAERGIGLTATYLTAWSVVEAERDAVFRSTLNDFNVCYADGIGVVYTLLLTRARRIKKVTANDFYVPLFQEAANRGIKIALIGAKEGVAHQVACQMRRDWPSLKIVLCSSGYLNNPEEDAVVDELRRVGAQLVLVGRGQPVQELWVQKCRHLLPNTVFLCVGGLFDYISGHVQHTPIWIRRIGLEWLHRFIHQPDRYWYIYVCGIPLLAWYTFKYPFTRAISWISGARESPLRG